MFEVLKKGATDLTLKAKGLFTSSEPATTYVKDLRKVMTYDGRKCQYPKNYDQIKKSGKIIKNEDMRGNPILDKDKNPTYRLVYGEKDRDGGRPVFELTEVTEIDGRFYFTIDFLVNPKKNKDVKHYDGYYKPFGFSKIDLEKHVPIFEAEKTKDPQYPFELTNSSVLTKEVKNKEGKVQEVVDEKGRNGELLYTSDYKKLSTSFSEIRDQNGKLELDKSLISVPIVLAAGLAKICTKLLTSLPIKLGEYLISKQNPVAKLVGGALFIPAAAVKNLVNIGATILKAPILLFVANEKKYGDAYYTMWKHQLKECWKEAKSDFNIIKGEEGLKPEQKDHKPLNIVGTWDELNARRSGIERDLEKALNKSSESIDKSREPDIGRNFKENPQNEFIAGFGNQKSGNTHVEKLQQNGRNSQQGQGATHTH